MTAAPYAIRVFGDPVLRAMCPKVESVDAKLRKLADDMIVTMYKAPGVGLAAPQIGVQKQIFVYDDGGGGGAHVLVNPSIVESSGEFEWDEGCLSVPDMYFPIVRPKRVRVKAEDLDGNEVDFVAEDFLGRIMQHEIDHLNGMLLLERLDARQRKRAMRELRERNMRTDA